ncbi:MAG: DUF3160 domain-containing protein [Anaerolineaceae bacterium]
MSDEMKRVIWIILSLAVILTMACSVLQPDSSNSNDEETETEVQDANAAAIETEAVPDVQFTPPANIYQEAFAEYPEIAVNYSPQFSARDPYTLPVDLKKVEGVEDLELSADQLDLLSRNGFVVLPPSPGEYREFYQIYESGRYSTTPVFVTTDAIFHVYHLLFDKMLRDLEREKFIPILINLTRTMQAESETQFRALQGTALEEPARRNLAFFAVAGQLLETGDPIPMAVQDMVAAELNLINGHTGPDISPIWDRDDLAADKKLIEDYSQYIPRGHYTRGPELEKYFKTMMWYGRLTFRLRDEFETRRALLMTSALRSAKTADGTTAEALWRNIYDPTVFIVGKADDLSFHEYGVLSDTIFGVNVDPKAFADQKKFGLFMQASEQLPPPQVNSMWVWITEDKEDATKGFRFMGQRFTLDAYVFGQMIWRNVGTLEEPRGLPKGLDFFAAMGSEEALNILNEMDETRYINFDTQMTKVKGEIAELEMDSWTQNLYWAWLYAFQPMISPKDSRYPPFMENAAWTRKDLHTALGSWTELKHDTILYAKQVMAEMGGGADDEPPHGYVEPNPEAYARLQALAVMTKSGLENRGLATPLISNNMDNLIEELKFLQMASEKELAGQALSDDDYWHIQWYGGMLEQFTLAAADTDDEMSRDLADQKAALIADVATGLNPGGDLAVLEEAIGQPTRIYVVLPDSPWRVAVGAVFTYYEFLVPPAGRMTDEAWQALVESGDIPDAPDWTRTFIVK